MSDSYLCSHPGMFRCTESNAEVILQSRFTGRKLKLTGREKQVLLDTWANVPNQMDVCRRVFAQIFLKKPALKRLWGLETVADAQLCEEEIFCRHADSFYKFFDLAVRSVSLEADYLVSVARSVGIRHCHFKEVSFDAENWLLFKNSVLDCILPYGVGLSSHSRKTTWNLFLAFIITEMKDAYCKEIHKLHTKPVAIFTDPEEQNLIKELEEKYEQCKAEEEEMTSQMLCD